MLYSNASSNWNVKAFSIVDCVLLDDFSRNILAWHLVPTLAVTAVETTPNLALEKTGGRQAKVVLACLCCLIMAGRLYPNC